MASDLKQPASQPSQQAPKTKREEKQKPPNPWERLPWPEHGDLDRKETFAGVGIALTQWAHYEAALCRLFSAFIAQDRDSHAARRAFGAVRTFEGRMDMLEAAASTYFAYFNDEDLQKNWTEIRKLGKHYSQRRNEIAHGAVLPFYPKIVGSGPNPDGVCLLPAEIDTKKQDVWGRATFAYNAESLNHYAYEFSNLTQAPQRLAVSIVMAAQAAKEKSPL